MRCWPTSRRIAPNLPTTAGNHERQLLIQSRERLGASDAHSAAELLPHHGDWLAGLPSKLQLNDEVFCCHGTPTSDLTYSLETVVPGFGGPGSGENGVRAVAFDWEAVAQRAEQEGRPDRAGALRTGFVTRLEGAA